MSALRSIGALAGGAAKGFAVGSDIKNRGEDAWRKQDKYNQESEAAKKTGKDLLDRLSGDPSNLIAAHKSANEEFGKMFADFLAPSPMTNLTGAAATDASAQTPGQFGGGMPGVNAQLAAPPPTPMITAMTRPRRLQPLSMAGNGTVASQFEE